MGTIRTSILTPRWRGQIRLGPTQLAAQTWRAISGGLVTALDWHERARQRRTLSELDDRMLRDLGLTRSDVYKECRKHFWEV